MTWYLTKDWVDPDDGVEAVQIHYMWTPATEGPYFDGTHQVRWLNDLGGHPRRRAKVLPMPREIWKDGGWNDDGFALHHHFEVFGPHGQWTTDTFTEEIVARDLEFVDDHGTITNICIYWAVGDWTAPTYSPMEDPRFAFESDFTSVRYYGYEDKARYNATKAEMLGQIDLPHRWRARMWGPRGSTLVQQYHVGHMHPEHERSEAFWGPEGVTSPGVSHWVHQL